MIEIVLKMKGLDKPIYEECDEMTSLQAKLILLETMDESHRTQVRGLTTPKEIMQRLKQIYSDETAANKYRMLLKYYRYVKTPADSMSEHIGKMLEMRKAVENCVF